MSANDILVDISHMSEDAIKETFALIQQLDTDAGCQPHQYPVIASHGVIAALGAAVYRGRIVLGFRLMFAQLPAEGRIGQFPREFLLSLGAIYVVGPALVRGAALGVSELLQADPAEKLIKEGHKPWCEAKVNAGSGAHT